MNAEFGMGNAEGGIKSRYADRNTEYMIISDCGFKRRGAGQKIRNTKPMTR